MVGRKTDYSKTFMLTVQPELVQFLGLFLFVCSEFKMHLVSEIRPSRYICAASCISFRCFLMDHSVRALAMAAAAMFLVLIVNFGAFAGWMCSVGTS